MKGMFLARSETVKSPWAGRDRAAEREEKREAVLHAAAQAFAEKGYHQTSLDDIAARLGVTKPTLYYYTRNKDDLIIGASSRAVDQIMDGSDTDPHASALIQLQSMLRRYAMVMTTNFGRCVDVMRAARVGGDAGEVLLEGTRKIDLRIRDLIQRGIEDGSITPCDPKLTAFVLAGAINGITRWFKDDGQMSAAAVAEALVNRLSDGLAPR